jgi:hypothetical protein
MLPRYAGPPGANIPAALPAQAAKQLLQVNVRLDPQIPAGEQAVHVRLCDGVVSNASSIRVI